MEVSLRQRALRLLARREHSRVELGRKLGPHAESPEQLEALLDDLAARRLISDTRYAEMRMNARAARFGNARLAHELRTQGVADEVVAAALAAEPEEIVRARAVWHRKFGDNPKAQDASERARQIRFMSSRGFSSETIRRLMKSDFEDD